MQPDQMNRLIKEHIGAEIAGDPASCVAVYTEDIEHDVVGAPEGPLHGKEAAHGFYEQLVRAIQTEQMTPVRHYYGDDFCVTEHQWTGSVPGEFLGVPGNGRTISFRMLHVWEFKNDLISRENIWLDGGSIVQQLTAPEAAAATA